MCTIKIHSVDLLLRYHVKSHTHPDPFFFFYFVWYVLYCFAMEQFEYFTFEIDQYGDLQNILWMAVFPVVVVFCDQRVRSFLANMKSLFLHTSSFIRAQIILKSKMVLKHQNLYFLRRSV